MGSDDGTEREQDDSDDAADQTIELTLVPRGSAEDESDGTVELTIAPARLPQRVGNETAPPIGPAPGVGAAGANAWTSGTAEAPDRTLELAEETLHLSGIPVPLLPVLPFTISARATSEPPVAPPPTGERTPDALSAAEPTAPQRTSTPTASRVPSRARGVARFAEIRARLDAREPRATVFATYDLNDARWQEEEERILSILADAAEQADLEKLREYQAAYRATLREVTGEEAVQMDASSTGSSETPAASNAATQPSAEPLVLGGLTLAQHAALCAELAFDPEHAADALARCRLTPTLKVALDRDWMTRLTDPKLAEEWHRANRAHAASLRSASLRPAAPHSASLPAEDDSAGEDGTLEVDLRTLRAPLPFTKDPK